MFRIARILTILLVVIALASETASSAAQPSDLQLIYDGDSLTHIHWNQSGLVLNYTSSSTFGELFQWYRYNLETQQTSQIVGSLNNADLPEAFQAQLPPLEYPDLPGRWAEAHISPNGRYLIYPTNKRDAAWQIGMKDLQTGQTVITDAFVWNAYAYHVIWDDASTKAVVFDRQSNDILFTKHHIYGYSESISNVISLGSKAVRLDDPPPSRDYSIYEPYQFSDGGGFILSIALDVNSAPYPAYLMLWNYEQPAQSRVLPNLNAEKTLAAIFAPNDPSKILLVNELGLCEYDLNTNTISVIDGRINEAWLIQQRRIQLFDSRYEYRRSRALFSPDGHWLAYYVDAEQSSRIYLLPTQR